MSTKKSRGICVLLLCVLALLSGCGGTPAEILPGESVSLTEAVMAASGAGQESRPAAAETSAGEIYVYVCGQVISPGVYRLPGGSRIQDGIEAAGGFAGDADREYWNLAQTLADGEQIRVPSQDESMSMAAAGAPVPTAASSGTPLVNLNTAGKEELMTLSGIGEARAAAIIAYREEHGGFSSTEEIMQVSGIKEGAYEKIKDQITVS